MKYHLQNIAALAIIVTLGAVGYTVLSTSAGIPLSVVSSKTVTGSSVAASSLPTETGSSVDAFIDSQGVNIHSSYLSTPYAIAGAVTNALALLHIHNVRDNVAVSPSPTEVSDITAWINAGIKYDFGIGASDQTRVAPLISEITGHGQAGGTVGVEGPNEASNGSSGPSDSSWVAADRTAQSALYLAVRGTPSLSGARVAGPSITGIHDGNLVAQNGWNDTALLGNLTGALDVGNAHAYPGAGKTPESTIGGHLTAEASVSGSKPIWATESGYNDCLA